MDPKIYFCDLCLRVFCLFSLMSFIVSGLKIFYLSAILNNFIIMCIHVGFLTIFCGCGLLILVLWVCSFHHIWKILGHVSSIFSLPLEILIIYICLSYPTTHGYTVPPPTPNHPISYSSWIASIALSSRLLIFSSIQFGKLRYCIIYF